MVHIVVAQAVQAVQAVGCTRVAGRTVLAPAAGRTGLVPVAGRIGLARVAARIVPEQVVAGQIVAWVAGVEIVSVDQLWLVLEQNLSWRCCLHGICLIEFHHHCYCCWISSSNSK